MQGTINSARQEAIKIAQKVIEQKPLYIDTETTGLDSRAEIVEISIVEHDGSVRFESLIRPMKPIPPEVERVHHITNQMVKDAKPWYVIWPELRSILNGRIVGFYNAQFDVRMMEQTHKQYGLPWQNIFQPFDIMKLYSQFRGIWDARRRSYKFFKLEAAGRDSNISLQNTHRATDDTLLTRELLHYIANYKLQA